MGNEGEDPSTSVMHQENLFWILGDVTKPTRFSRIIIGSKWFEVLEAFPQI